MGQEQTRVVGRMEPIRIGSEAHKELFCRVFIETHRPFEPEKILWPDLNPEGLQRLKSLPVWSEAARTESETAVKVQTLAPAPLRPVFDARRCWVIAGQLVEHARLGASFGGDESQEGFEMKSHTAFGEISTGEFLQLCLSENDRRLGLYDSRLLRPRLVLANPRARCDPGQARARGIFCQGCALTVARVKTGTRGGNGV